MLVGFDDKPHSRACQTFERRTGADTLELLSNVQQYKRPGCWLRANLFKRHIKRVEGGAPTSGDTGEDMSLDGRQGYIFPSPSHL